MSENDSDAEMLFQTAADARRPRQQNVSIFRVMAIADKYISASAERKRKAEHLHKSHIRITFCFKVIVRLSSLESSFAVLALCLCPHVEAFVSVCGNISVYAV